MAKRDRRIDAYIAQSAEFARPILTHLRAVVHEACPDVEETMKWSFPHFMHQGMLCAMAAFKQHATFGFWRGSLVVGPSATAQKAMGQFGRIARLADLPPRTTIVRFVKKAAALNEAGVKPARKKTRVVKKAVAAPADLRAALQKNASARKTFDAFSPSHRREYVEWIVGAKREETRQRRVATAVAWMAEGKAQNWRYQR
jgi:uncharacterized protein YdeI (YjbR/CyaY-like superfamily)